MEYKIGTLKEMAEEQLRPELAICVTDGPLGPMIANPFCHAVTFVPGMANRQYEFQKARAYEALDEKDWHTWVFCHERPYRTDALTMLLNFGHLNYADEAFCKLARDVWVDCENIPQHLDQWEMIFHFTDGELWMDPEEKVHLHSMSDRIRIYRGECNDLGYSWTLNYNVAKFFAKRKLNEATGIVKMGYVRRKDVFALLLTRGEEEIIVTDPSKIHIAWGRDVTVNVS